MRSAADLHSQIASIVEVLANAAVAEICKAVEDEYAAVNVEMSRGQRENECLRRRVKLLELQVSRYRAEQRLKAQDGAGPGRLFPGVRLLQHRHGTKDAPAGSSLQIRPRFLNRPQQKSHTDLDQDPDQEVVTTTKTEPTEPEEDDIIIVKVEGSVSLQDNNNNKSSTPLAQTSEIQAQSSSRTESQKSQEHSSRVQMFEEQVWKHEGDSKNTSPRQEEQHLYPILTFADPHANVRQLLNSVCQNENFSSQPCTEIQTKEIGEVLEFNNGQNARSLNPHSSSVQTKEPANVQNRQSTDTFPNELSNLPHPCLFCPRRFAQQNQLIGHESVHRAMKPYECDQCQRVFDCFGHLKRHKLVHTGARPYPCAHCGKRFTTFYNLKAHQSIHTGERKFKCEICGKTYAFHSNLIRHQAVHGKE